MKRYKTVDEYISNAEQWQPELVRLREILTSMPLDECTKWGAPCYTVDGKNVVGIGGFKSYFGLWFFQGALLPDDSNVLMNAQDGKTKAMRQWRMASTKDIKVRLIRSYVKTAIELANSGKEIKPARGKPVVIPTALEAALAKKRTAATAAFAKLTPGRQREYADYISDAKRDNTKQKRIEKILPMILDGGGLNDKYRNC